MERWIEARYAVDIAAPTCVPSEEPAKSACPTVAAITAKDLIAPFTGQNHLDKVFCRFGQKISWYGRSIRRGIIYRSRDPRGIFPEIQSRYTDDMITRSKRIGDSLGFD